MEYLIVWRLNNNIANIYSDWKFRVKLSYRSCLTRLILNSAQIIYAHLKQCNWTSKASSAHNDCKTFLSPCIKFIYIYAYYIVVSSLYTFIIIIIERIFSLQTWHFRNCVFKVYYIHTQISFAHINAKDLINF